MLPYRQSVILLKVLAKFDHKIRRRPVRNFRQIDQNCRLSSLVSLTLLHSWLCASAEQASNYRTSNTFKGHNAYILCLRLVRIREPESTNGQNPKHKPIYILTEKYATRYFNSNFCAPYPSGPVRDKLPCTCFENRNSSNILQVVIQLDVRKCVMYDMGTKMFYDTLHHTDFSCF